jgi:hypothetical protein
MASALLRGTRAVILSLETKTSIIPEISEPINMNGIASIVMLKKTILNVLSMELPSPITKGITRAPSRSIRAGYKSA